MIIFVLIGIAWVICGVLSRGYFYNFVQLEFANIAENDEPGHAFTGNVLGLTGPIGLLVIVFTGATKYGLRFRRYKYVNGVRQP